MPTKLKDLQVNTTGYLHDLFVAKVLVAWKQGCRQLSWINCSERKLGTAKLRFCW